MSDRYVALPLSKMEGVPPSCLHTGARFLGLQTTKFQQVEIEIDILNVEPDNDYLCGYVTLVDLNYNSEEFRQRTFFNGEIISKRYPFPTGKWFADAKIDKMYWWKFGCFHKFKKAFSPEGDFYDYNELKKEDIVYMRWKEVPRVGSENGLIGPGFHYVRLSKSDKTIETLYYEPYQKITDWFAVTLNAQYLEERGVPVFQFR